MSDSHLLAFHIGPVQDFIATARRTQDWWMGSWLLSHLSRTAIHSLPGKEESLTLPKLSPGEHDQAIASTPNHFFAEITGENPAEVAGKVEASVREEWSRIGQVVKDRFFRTVDGALWQRQVDNFLEVYWVIAPYDGSRKARNQAQEALEARKRLRNFRPANEPRLKCTLCGLRQEMSARDSVPAARDWWQRVVKARGQVRVKEDGNERLCAVCAVKRVALAAEAVPLKGRDGHFPSTSSVAAAPFKAALLKSNAVEEALKSHFTKLGEIGGEPQPTISTSLPRLCQLSEGSPLPSEIRTRLLQFDGDLFYPETFREKRFLEEYPGARGTILDRLKKGYDASEEEILDAFPNAVSDGISRGVGTLRNIYHVAGSHPSSYYAALMMDGDHMGRFFGQAENEPAQSLSQGLSQFAREQAKEVVEKHLGRLVYAGGDDTMALLPLEEGLPGARELWQGFNQTVAKALQGSGLPKDVWPTPSIGIALAHHTAPLDGVLLAMQRAGKSAKNEYGRNALCVHVLKRSGEEVRVGTNWEEDGQPRVELVEDAVSYLRDGILSMKFAYDLADEVRGLGAESLPAEARATALKRLARRHSPQDKREKAEILATKLAAWAEGKKGEKGKEKPLGIEEVAQWVLLACFIARGGSDE